MRRGLPFLFNTNSETGDVMRVDRTMGVHTGVYTGVYIQGVPTRVYIRGVPWWVGREAYSPVYPGGYGREAYTGVSLRGEEKGYTGVSLGVRKRVKRGSQPP